jgi:hypothetical protein
MVPRRVYKTFYIFSRIRFGDGIRSQGLCVFHAVLSPVLFLLLVLHQETRVGSSFERREYVHYSRRSRRFKFVIIRSGPPDLA